MTVPPLASLGPIEVAVTVDELLLWEGSPMPAGYSRRTVARDIATALNDAGVPGVYGFAHTSPLEDDPSLRDVLEGWVSAGHHLGNHTHAHASLNWVDANTYCRDIDTADKHIGDLIDLAPHRYFRYAMDMSGPEEARRGQVEDHLTKLGYTNAPITAWFGDFAWIVPYYRALTLGDHDAADLLRKSYIQAAMFNLSAHAVSARDLFGRDLPYIWLIHGTPIARDCLPDILNEFRKAGVRFVGLENAMNDVLHRVMPPAAPTFRNHLQRFGIAAGREVQAAPASAVQAILSAAPMAGEYEDSIAAYDNILRRCNDTAKGHYDWDWTTV